MGAIQAVIALLVVFEFISWTAVQVAAVEGVLAAVLSVIVRQVVMPTVKQRR
jgi:hypothetical protein